MPYGDAGMTYRPQAVSSSIEADRLAFRLLSQRSNAERIAITSKFTKGARKLSLMGLKATFGYLDPDAFRLKVAQAWLEDFWPVDVEHSISLVFDRG